MTEAKVNPYCDTKSEFFQWAKELEQLAQAGLKKEIATHQANGRPLFYLMAASRTLVTSSHELGAPYFYISVCYN